MPKQGATKTNSKTQTQFSFMKSLGFFLTITNQLIFPVGFENHGTNVCLFSSVMQILFSLSSFQNYVQQSSYDNQGVVFIKGLLKDIKLSRTSVI